MSEWQYLPIRDLIDSQWPGEWGTEHNPYAPAVVVYRSTDIDDDGHLLEESGGVYRALDSKKVAAKKLLPGDILLEASGGTPDRPVGRVAVFSGVRSELSVCANFLRTLRPKKGVSSDFLRWVLLSLQRQSAIWRYQQQTTGIINLKVADYLNHKIETPPLPQQRRIAEILSTLDDAIEQTEALIAKHQQIKAGLMHDLFTRGATPDGHLRPTREQAPDLYKESPLGWIPKEWNYRPCSHICERITVGIVIRPAQYYVEHGVPAFRSANVRETGIDASDFVFISKEANDLLAKSQVRAGDILTVRTGYPGTSAVVPDEFSGANAIDILLSRPTSEVNSFFLCYWINSSFGKGHVLRTQGGLAQQHFNVGELRDLPVALPKLDEQRVITERLDSLTQHIRCEESALVKWVKMKHGLMHDLLSGGVRVPITEQ